MLCLISLFFFFLILLFFAFIQNQEPGAEEAFKILGHAFEMIGEPVSFVVLIAVKFKLSFIQAKAYIDRMRPSHSDSDLKSH